MTHPRDSLLERIFVGAAGLAFAALIASSGCEPQEKKVLDIEAPGVDIEVNKSNNGDRSVDVKTHPEPDQ